MNNNFINIFVLNIHLQCVGRLSQIQMDYKTQKIYISISNYVF